MGLQTNEKCAIIKISDIQRAFLEFCKEFGWGKIEVTIQNGEPVSSKELERTHRHTN